MSKRAENNQINTRNVWNFLTFYYIFRIISRTYFYITCTHTKMWSYWFSRQNTKLPNTIKFQNCRFKSQKFNIVDCVFFKRRKGKSFFISKSCLQLVPPSNMHDTWCVAKEERNPLKSPTKWMASRQIGANFLLLCNANRAHFFLRLSARRSLCFCVALPFHLSSRRQFSIWPCARAKRKQCDTPAASSFAPAPPTTA